MKHFISITTLLVFVLSVTAVPYTANAQWSVGASYEIRNEKPENGFGFRLEREILQQIPLTVLKLRGHFSYFEEDNYAGVDGITYGKIKNYDFGLAAVGGISVGLLTPYIGTGLGSITTELRSATTPSGEEGAESSVFWNGFIGAEVSPIPALKPFVEYRIQSVGDFNELQNSVNNSRERLIFGLSIAF